MMMSNFGAKMSLHKINVFGPQLYEFKDSIFAFFKS